MKRLKTMINPSFNNLLERDTGRIRAFRRTGWVVLLFLLIYTPQTIRAQSCSATSAILCVAGDDDTYVWINGNPITTNQPSAGGTLFPYVNWDQPGTPVCVNVPTADLVASPGANMFAAVTYNRHCCEVWTSWSLDISCLGGNHTVVTNASSGVSLYYDAGGGTPPPNDAGAHLWHDPIWTNPNPAVFFKDPIFTDTGTIWGKEIYDPSTGKLLPPSSYSAGGGAAGNQTLYWRQGFTLSTSVTALGPPNFTITKSANPTSGIQSSQRVTYTLNVCNTGQAMSIPVTIIDNFTPDMRFDGPLTAPFTTGVPEGQVNSGGSSVTFIFLKGFPGGGACTLIQYKMTDDIVDNSEFCAVRPNTASVNWNSSAVSASAAITLFCPPFTLTFTPTPTYTPTFTRTPTPTWTNTLPPGTYTPTPVYTSTPTYTFTPTWTVTATYSPVPGSCSLPPSRTASQLACLTMSTQTKAQPAVFGPTCYSRGLNQANENQETAFDSSNALFVASNVAINNLVIDYSHSENGGPLPEDSRQAETLFAMISRGIAYVRPS
jgi:hypothetical protein